MLVMMLAGWVNAQHRERLTFRGQPPPLIIRKQSLVAVQLVGELSKLGHRVSRSTVRRLLRERGIGPAPERLPHMPWSKFLKAHWEAIAAADFFTVEVWTSVGLVRYLVFLVIDLSSRRVEIAGIAPVPDGLWMRQATRRLIDDLSGFLRGKRFLIHDRDPLYTRGFHEVLSYAGVAPVRLPPKSPNLNAYAEYRRAA